MEFNLGSAVVAGLVGTVAMTVVMYMGRLMGMRMDMPMTLGTMFLPKGTAAWAVGLMAHLMMGVVFFILYAGLFAALGVRTGLVGWGALFGVAHALMAGAVMGMMPAMHPRMADGPGASADTVPAPGFFGTRMGAAGPMGIVALHVVYGAVAATVYAL